MTDDEVCEKCGEVHHSEQKYCRFPLRLSDAVQELWGLGLTVTPRSGGDIMDVAVPPSNKSYQWMDKEKADGWVNVSYFRHPGIYAPFDTEGDINYDGMWLMERPKSEVDAAHQAAHAKAKANVDNWFKRYAGEGFTGSVTSVTERSNVSRETSKTIIGDENTEFQVMIPHELVDHVGEILAERDRMVEEAKKVTPEIPEELRERSLYVLRSSCLQMAIDVIRRKYKGDQTDGVAKGEASGAEENRDQRRDGSGV